MSPCWCEEAEVLRDAALGRNKGALLPSGGTTVTTFSQVSSERAALKELRYQKNPTLSEFAALISTVLTTITKVV